MAIRKIATVGHPVLRQVARELTKEELRSAEIQRFIDDLVETMHDAAGAGLAANQVYEPIRITAIEINKNPRYPYKPNYPLTILVNPVVTPTTDDTFLNYEGCLSVPNLRGEVRRFTGVRVRAWDREGNDLDFEVKGLTAGTFQHEVDHLDGKVFLDRVEDTRSLTTWADFERFHMAAFVERAKALVAKHGA
ncbi:MAG: peptide deformylase [Myxococcales bacterium 68-20]|nr:peptide deformylase [Myxococcales bacterium]OJY24302.1 MAG: peptide deformylase [Myxococcales bacterium 68-20]